jgi:hypothetical protein
MKRVSRLLLSVAVVALAAVSIAALTHAIHAADHPMGAGPAAHGMMSGHSTMQNRGQGAEDTRGMASGHPMTNAQGQGMHGMMGGQGVAGKVPTRPGQDAFGAIQEIVGILEADPATDWSKVDLEAVRRHLVDMNEVTLNAEAAAKAIEGGVEIAVTGSGRTAAAIRRMVPAHAAEIDGLNGWRATSAPLANGVLLTVTSGDAKEVAHIRGLGFIGILASGHHHQPHHLAMAKGELPYPQ